jgi:hypothetical protein
MAIQLQTTKESPCVFGRVEFYSAPPTIDYNKTSEPVSVIVTNRPYMEGSEVPVSVHTKSKLGLYLQL